MFAICWETREKGDDLLTPHGPNDTVYELGRLLNPKYQRLLAGE